MTDDLKPSRDIAVLLEVMKRLRETCPWDRVQTFDTDGTLKGVWRLPGPPWSLCLTQGPQQALFVGSVGKIYKIDTTSGKIVGQFGHIGRFPGTIDSIHQLACPDEKTLYIVNEFSSRLDKWVSR